MSLLFDPRTSSALAAAYMMNLAATGYASSPSSTASVDPSVSMAAMLIQQQQNAVASSNAHHLGLTSNMPIMAQAPRANASTANLSPPFTSAKEGILMASSGESPKTVKTSPCSVSQQPQFQDAATLNNFIAMATQQQQRSAAANGVSKPESPSLRGVSTDGVGEKLLEVEEIGKAAAGEKTSTPVSAKKQSKPGRGNGLSDGEPSPTKGVTSAVVMTANGDSQPYASSFRILDLLETPTATNTAGVANGGGGFSSTTTPPTIPHPIILPDGESAAKQAALALMANASLFLVNNGTHQQQLRPVMLNQQHSLTRGNGIMDCAIENGGPLFHLANAINFQRQNATSGLISAGASAAGLKRPFALISTCDEDAAVAGGDGNDDSYEGEENSEENGGGSGGDSPANGHHYHNNTVGSGLNTSAIGFGLHRQSSTSPSSPNGDGESNGGSAHHRDSAIFSHGGKKARKARTIFTDKQLQELELMFDKHKYLSVQDRMDLAHRMGLTDTQVKTWYQNRRTKWKRQAAVGVDLLHEASNLAAVQNLIRTNPSYWAQYMSNPFLAQRLLPALSQAGVALPTAAATGFPAAAMAAAATMNNNESPPAAGFPPQPLPAFMVAAALAAQQQQQQLSAMSLASVSDIAALEGITFAGGCKVPTTENGVANGSPVTRRSEEKSGGVSQGGEKKEEQETDVKVPPCENVEKNGKEPDD